MKPEKITRITLAAQAARRWDGQYGVDAAPDKKAISLRLHRLGPAPSPDDVDKAVGNKSWTNVPRCDACERNDLDAVVRVGEAPDYESATAHLCRSCLLEAAALYDEEST